MYVLGLIVAETPRSPEPPSVPGLLLRNKELRVCPAYYFQPRRQNGVA